MKKLQFLKTVRAKIKPALPQRAECSSFAEAVLEIKLLHAEIDN